MNLDESFKVVVEVSVFIRDISTKHVFSPEGPTSSRNVRVNKLGKALCLVTFQIGLSLRLFR